MVVVFFGVTLVLAVSTSDCDSDRMGSNPIGHPKENCLVNSAVEGLLYTEKVGGSIPSQGTRYSRIVKWYNGGLISLYRKFDSCSGNQMPR